MCGIVGLWVTKAPDCGAAEAARRMADAVAYRGPDDAGEWTDDREALAFGHRRLSIIDVSAAGHQPMRSADGRFVITFNGEIYNHRDLRAEVERAGAAPAWRGHSDTETLLAAIAAWGLTETLRRVVGMFALALWDRQTSTLQLARDRLGEKPLYYAWVDGGLLFGSELKALCAYPGFRRAVDRDVLALYMQFGNVPAPYAIYEQVRKLQPASIVTFTRETLRQREPKIEEYWRFFDAAGRGLAHPFADEQEAMNALEAQLKIAVHAQSQADVPLGVFLSGGIDSSLVTALMQLQCSRPVKSYTVGFDEADFDESPFARAVAAHLGTEHHELLLRAEDARAVIPRIPVIYDEPFADSSQIATHLVAGVARTQVKVALSGDGGDELFGGYNRYLWSRRVWRVWSRLPMPLRKTALLGLGSIPVATFDRLGQLLGTTSKVAHFGTKAHKVLQRLELAATVNDMHRLLLTEWPPERSIVLGAQPLCTPEDPLAPDTAELEEAMMMLDTVSYLPDDVLTKVDRAAMSVSLETRVPFLDHRVVELACRLPLRMKLRDGQGKWALRQILYKHVPERLLERPKAGFAVPLGEWLRGPLRPWAEHLLDRTRIEREGYLDAAPIGAAWEQHLCGRQDWTQRLWYVLIFQSWLERNS